MKTLPAGVKPKALCYIRLSQTRNDADLLSPERQRANIQAVCDMHGWEPVWFEDAKGHKSGRTEDRPGWQDLKTHIDDPGIVAIVANDFSRLHRKLARMSDLLELCDEKGLDLVQAAPGRHFDTSTPAGKMFAQFQAMMDQNYADEGSFKAKDSARYRKDQGVIVGMTPFGTERPPSREGKPAFLRLSPFGIWLLPDGSFVKGREDEPPAVDNAIWRGYAQAAERCLRLYVENRYGMRELAKILNKEGYRHHSRNPKHLPNLFTVDHVRAMIANWPEYGGAVIGKIAKTRKAHEYTADNVTLFPEKAVFDLDLLYQVARTRGDRTVEMKQPDYSTPGNAAAYPLSNILFCAHCDRLAIERNDPSLRTYFTGMHAQSNRQARYRHKDTKRHCAAKTASVVASIVEADFARLVRALTVNPDAVPILADWFNRFNQLVVSDDAKKAKQAEIVHYQMQIRNTNKLFMSARISEQDFAQHTQECERQIARLQAELSQDQQVEHLLKMTVEMLTDTDKNWDQATADERQQFARRLFTEIVYDLDARRIVSFKLKPWAESFLQLRVALAELFPETKPHDIGDNEGLNSEYSLMASAGCRPVSRPCASVAIVWRSARIGPAYHSHYSSESRSRLRNLSALSSWWASS